MHVAPIDIDDDDLVRQWWEVGKAGDEHERPHATYWPLQAAKGSLRAPNAADHHALACWDGDQIVGINEVVLPQLDNQHIAYQEPIVRPDRWREGIGTALLEAGMELGRGAGRTTFIAEVHLPMTAAGTESSSPGALFLERHGFAVASKDIHRVLELPADQQVLDALEADALGHATGYELVSFGDRVPDELLDGYCALQIAFNAEAPMGDLDIEPEHWDAERVRKAEERSRQQRRHHRCTAAIAPDGSMAALTEMMASDEHPDYGFQGGTLVLPSHRGRRLGMATKIANLRRYVADFPAVERVHSWNAEVNGPMVAINDAIGFRPVEYLAEMQRRDGS